MSERILHTPAVARLPDGWSWARLDAVAAVFDCPHSTPRLTDSGPYVVRSQDIRTGIVRLEQAARVSDETYRDRVSRAEPRFGDLLFSREGTYFGIAAEVPDAVRICLGQRMVLIRPKEDVVSHRFVRFWLNSPIMARHIDGFRDGSVAERLNMPTIRNLPVPVAPMAVQQKIAHILGTLDDKIELNRKMNETLEEMARALFKSWFVDFDSVRAKAEGRQPFGMDAATAALFPDSFEESELGMIPTGWHVTALPELVDMDPPRSLRRGVEAPYVDMASLSTIGPRPSDVRTRQFASGSRFLNGDTLFARITPCLENGKTGFVDWLAPGEVGWGSTEFIVLRPKPPIPPEWGYLLARYQPFREFAVQKMQGSSGRQRVPTDALAGYRLVRCSDEVAQLFGRQVQPHFALIAHADEESRTLAAVRETLLPKLLAGELRIKNADKFAADSI